MSEISTSSLNPLASKTEDTIAHKGRRFHQRDELKQQMLEIEDGLEAIESEDRVIEDYYPEATEDWDDQEIDRMRYLFQEQGIVTMPRQGELEKLADVLDKQADDRQIRREDKEKLHMQRLEKIRAKQIGAARIIESLSIHIAYSPDSTVDEMMNLVTDQAQDIGLETSDINAFQTALESYVAKHKTVEEYYRFLSPEAVFSACFDQLPKGVVEMEKGAMTLLLRCFDKDDYAMAFYHSRSTVPQLSGDQIKHALSSGGLAFSDVADPRLHGTIILENAVGGRSSPSRREIEAHEQQHQINKLFSPVEYQLSNDFMGDIFSDPTLTPEKALKKYVTHAVRLERRRIGIDSRARDELIAYYSDGTTIDRAVSILLNNNLYDYKSIFAKRIGRIPQDILNGFDIYLTVNRDEGDEIAPLVHKNMDRDMLMNLINLAIGEIIGRGPTRDYEALLNHWTGAIKVLESKKYPREKILALMYENAATHWWSIARSMPSFEDDGSNNLPEPHY